MPIRRITVDKLSYKYRVWRYGEGFDVYQDGKILFYISFNGENTVTPKLVAQYIRERRQKLTDFDAMSDREKKDYADGRLNV